MHTNIIGRTSEMKLFQQILDSDKSEFIAVCGRRRVGKTFLIREFFETNIVFQMAGLANRPTDEQLRNFSASLELYSHNHKALPADWLDAFHQLTLYLLSLPEGRKVIFLDELPWMDTNRSNFMAGLEHFWNGWASARHDIVLIVCGSATSWMMDKLINNHGGLYNRLTRRVFLQPFSLKETDDLLHSKGIFYSHYDVAVCYMIMGGIPFYLSLLDNEKSLAQNIDALFFSPSGQMRSEFANLYSALFRNSADYILIVQALSKKMQGLTRNDIIAATGLKSGSALNSILSNLEACGFIRSYSNFAFKKKDVIYQLVDFYTQFYFHFIEGRSFRSMNYWTAIQSSPSFSSWAGYTFEQLALSHKEQILRKLGISGVLTEAYAWRSHGLEKNVQIDLIIDRNDHTINLCEMKFYNGPFSIDKGYSQQLQDKIFIFQQQTKTRKSIQLTLISSYGVTRNAYSNIMTNEVTLDDLFID